MTLPIFPTAYIPSVSYIAHLAKYDAVVIEQKETFPKQTFRNRAVIATGNGPLMLNVPVVRTCGNHTPTELIAISYQEPWHIRHWRAIVSAYNAAPYFLFYRDDLEAILMKQHEHLIDLNYALLKYLLAKFKISCTITFTDTYLPATLPPDTLDFRSCLSDKHSLTSYNSLPAYPQVFDSLFGFQPNLSSIDLLFNMGPEAKSLLSTTLPE